MTNEPNFTKAVASEGQVKTAVALVVVKSNVALLYLIVMT